MQFGRLGVTMDVQILDFVFHFLFPQLALSGGKLGAELQEFEDQITALCVLLNVDEVSSGSGPAKKSQHN